MDDGFAASIDVFEEPPQVAPTDITSGYAAGAEIPWILCVPAAIS